MDAKKLIFVGILDKFIVKFVGLILNNFFCIEILTINLKQLSKNGTKTTT